MKDTAAELFRQFEVSDPETPFHIEYWDGTGDHFGQGQPLFTVRFKSPKALSHTLVKRFLGFGESYMDGDVEVEGDWESLFKLAMRSNYQHRRPSLRSVARYYLLRLRTRDTRRKARANISRHYDRGNDFYSLWLDESMTYSCAYFETPETPLEQAQETKLERICRKLRLQPNMTLLDVGCGWGSLLIHAARHYEVHGVGCTLSENQARFARQRVAEAGVADRVEILFRDYREVDGLFDRWASVGMAEHVGRAFIPRFTRHIRRRLRPGGLGLLHFIGKDRKGFGDPWTLTYIFPGGYLPSLAEVLRRMGRHDLRAVDIENLRPHYALTLDRWLERFRQNVNEIRRMYDERFVRMWRLFLLSSAAGFRYGDTRVFQILFSRGATDETPLTREELMAAPVSAP
jgi:cyclopropane-fatty-acyl-phospholipid synthase